MDWTTLIVSLVSSLVAIGSISYTAYHQRKTDGRLADHKASIDKELSKFQNQLQLDSQREFERFRSSLEVQIVENRWIRERRFGIIQELYGQISDALFLAETMVSFKAENPIPLIVEVADMIKEKSAKEKAVELAGLLANFSKCYSKNRIFLSKDTCAVLDGIHSDAGILLAIAPFLTSLFPSGHIEKGSRNEKMIEFLEEKSADFVAKFKDALVAFEEEARKVLPEDQ